MCHRTCNWWTNTPLSKHTCERVSFCSSRAQTTARHNGSVGSRNSLSFAAATVSWRCGLQAGGDNATITARPVCPFGYGRCGHLRCCHHRIRAGHLEPETAESVCVSILTLAPRQNHGENPTKARSYCIKDAIVTESTVASPPYNECERLLLDACMAYISGGSQTAEGYVQWPFSSSPSTYNHSSSPSSLFLSFFTLKPSQH